MPRKTISASEVDGIRHVVQTAARYLEHPDVESAVPGAPVTRRKLEAVWGLVWAHLQQHPARPVPSRALAAKLSYASQEAADVLSDPRVRQISFALPSQNVARVLRDVVARMKDFR